MNEDESEIRYQAIVKAFDGLIYICSQDYRIEFMNDNLIKRTGRDAVGEFCYKALHDLNNVCPWCVNDRVFQGETVRWEVLSPKDNRWYYSVNTPIHHQDGSISKQAMIMDVTERKQAEQELKQHRKHLDQLVELRTNELNQINDQLQQEIADRKSIEERIGRQSHFLENILESLNYPFYVIDVRDYTIKIANTAAHQGRSLQKSTCFKLTHNRTEPSRKRCPAPWPR